MTVEDYQAATLDLATTTAQRVAAVYAALADGQITQAVAEQLIAAIVGAANATAYTLADVWLAVQIENLAGEVTLPVGVLAVDDTDRLAGAVNTILSERAEDGPDPVMRLDRLARAEPLDAGHSATSEAMREQALVEGWTRQMDADPCQLCRWWWREGRVWPKQHPFQRHKGCNCQPRIVLAEQLESTGYVRQLERNRAS